MGLPLRVLQVVVNMNRGGAETLIMNLYRHMDRSKIQFDFLTCKEGCFDDEIEKLGGRVYRIPYLTDGGHFQYIEALKKFFRAHPDYRVVHAHMDKMSGFVLHEAKKAGIPIRISHSHNTSSEGNSAARTYKWISGLYVLRSATHYLACSQKAAKWLYGSNAERAFIVKNGIDCHQFYYSKEVRNRLRKQWGLDDKCFVVGHIGRFNLQKNHEWIARIFSEIVNFNPNAYLVLIGEGPLRKSIEEKLKFMGLSEKVKFLGIRSDVHKLLNAFDVMLFPSLHEGLPVTLIEAQSVGLPCLISDRISPEVDMGAGLIHYESLSSTPKSWAYRALLMDDRVEDTHSYIKKNGYDIKDSAAWLESFYLQDPGILVEEETG